MHARDSGTVLGTNHKSSINYTPATSEAVLFAGANACVLSPEVTEGPYCKLCNIYLESKANYAVDVSNEYVRSDIRDGQKGVELILDTQVIDIATCNPVNYALVEVWRKFFFPDQ